MQNWQDVQRAAAVFLRRLKDEGADILPETAIILGTGLSRLGKTLAGAKLSARVPFADLPGFPVPGVESHSGDFLATELGALPVIVQRGRCHLYEGRSPAKVVMGVRMLAEIGVKNLIITNAAGALNPVFQAGTLMLLTDIINHTGASPLAGSNYDPWGERFPDMSEPLDREFRELAAAVALKLGITLEKGVYIGVRGPEMETPAETRMYRQWGADAVGMSSVLEIAAARHRGMRILAISCLTNKNLPDCMEPAPLVKVVETAFRCGENLGALLTAFCAKLADGQKNAYLC